MRTPAWESDLESEIRPGARCLHSVKTGLWEEQVGCFCLEQLTQPVARSRDSINSHQHYCDLAVPTWGGAQHLCKRMGGRMNGAVEQTSLHWTEED